MSTQWHNKDSKKKEPNEDIRAFLLEYVELCKNYGITISHEDTHGGFELEPFSIYNIKWMMDCSVTKQLEAKLPSKED